MENTYQNMLKLANLYDRPGRDINIVTLQYKKSQDPIQFAYVFCKLYPYMVTQASKFFYLAEADKASFCVEELSKAMGEFRLTKNASIYTLFSVYLHNRLLCETKLLSYIKRKANNDTDNYESLDRVMFEDESYDTVDLVESLKSMNLSDRELRYCQIIIKDSGNIKDTDIARMLGVSSAAITYLKERLTKKLIFA